MDERIYSEIIEACRPFYLYYPTSPSNCPSHHHQDLTAFAAGANRFVPSSTSAMEPARLLETPAATTNDGDRAGHAYSTVSSCPAVVDNDRTKKVLAGIIQDRIKPAKLTDSSRLPFSPSHWFHFFFFFLELHYTLPLLAAASYQPEQSSSFSARVKWLSCLGGRMVCSTRLVDNYRHIITLQATTVQSRNACVVYI
jgi:hypothetical protein